MDIEEQRQEDIREAMKIKERNVSLIVDSYDALFSDFDARTYSEKSISDDFLIECRRAVREKEGISELRILIPKHLRKPYEEGKIKRRLKEYFRKHSKETEREIKHIKRNGIIWFIMGSMLLVISTLLYEYKIVIKGFFNFIFNFLFIISQPAGWFICWEGLERIFIASNKKSEDYVFYKKMSEAEIYFLDY